MREETKRKLDNLARAQRTSRATAVIVGTVVCLLFGALFPSSRQIVSEKQVNGTVRWASAVPDKNLGQWDYSFQAELEDGRLISAKSTQETLPQIGSRVIMREISTAIGYRSYVWDGSNGTAEMP